MSEENQKVLQCQNCGNIQLLAQKRKCIKCGYRTLEERDLLTAIELQEDFQEQPIIERASTQDLTPELSKLVLRSAKYLFGAIFTFVIGIIWLLISIPIAASTLGYSTSAQPIIFVFIGFLFISASGILSIAWLFTSSISLHAAAVVRALGKK